MKNRILEKNRELEEKGGKSFSIVLMIGDPNTETTDRLVDIAVDSGVDVIELGIPYNNPFLDSSVMKASMQRALQWSNNMDDYLNYLSHIRINHPDTAFEIMIYYDTVMQIGMKRFGQALKDSEMDAVLVADYIYQEAQFLSDFDKTLEGTGVIPIRFVPHPFNNDQIQDIKENARGFFIAQTPVNEKGERIGVHDSYKEKINYLRQCGINTRIIAAYGIKTSEDIRKCLSFGADGVLLGTLALEKAFELPNEEFRKLITTLRKATS